jgi:hypothetical protein
VAQPTERSHPGISGLKQGNHLRGGGSRRSNWLEQGLTRSGRRVRGRRMPVLGSGLQRGRVSNLESGKAPEQRMPYFSSPRNAPGKQRPLSLKTTGSSNLAACVQLLLQVLQKPRSRMPKSPGR